MTELPLTCSKCGSDRVTFIDYEWDDDAHEDVPNGTKCEDCGHIVSIHWRRAILHPEFYGTPALAVAPDPAPDDAEFEQAVNELVEAADGYATYRTRGMTDERNRCRNEEANARKNVLAWTACTSLNNN